MTNYDYNVMQNIKLWMLFFVTSFQTHSLLIPHAYSFLIYIWKQSKTE